MAGWLKGLLKRKKKKGGAPKAAAAVKDRQWGPYSESDDEEISPPTNSTPETDKSTSSLLDQLWGHAEAFLTSDFAAVCGCSPRDLNVDFNETVITQKEDNGPQASYSSLRAVRTHEEIEVSPAHHIQVRLPPEEQQQNRQNKPSKRKFPVTSLQFPTEIERSISELTMRSSSAVQLKTLPQKSRRMAYYAVGKHSGASGNRRCYFTGKLILGGAPFYAGTVQQGMRSLVVFLLPSAVQLPDKDRLVEYSRNLPTKNANTILSVQPRSTASMGHRPLRMDSKGQLYKANSLTGRTAASVASKSRMSSVDESLSMDGDLCPNWGLDCDVLLAVLPDASPKLLRMVADAYPEQFETLPVQVRQPAVWKLYVKFCFFSGLPIANDDLHYKVRDDVADAVYGEEIALSHDVLEAATASAELLTLPNRAVLKYLQKHYAQQCKKLEPRVFERSNWQRMAPEV